MNHFETLRGIEVSVYSKKEKIGFLSTCPDTESKQQTVVVLDVYAERDFLEVIDIAPELLTIRGYRKDTGKIFSFNGRMLVNHYRITERCKWELQRAIKDADFLECE